MPCLVALFALISPRLALFAIWVFGSLLDRAYDSWIVPVIGFFLLPWTTLAYALMWGFSTNGVQGLEWIVVALAAFLDLGVFRQSRQLREARG